MMTDEIPQNNAKHGEETPHLVGAEGGDGLA